MGEAPAVGYKNRLKKLIPAPVRRTLKDRVLDSYAVKSYSQEGEDMILRRLFESRPTGFYVDVGAHHPKRFSNTYYFYKAGWHGINIDAMPGSMTAFRKIRPRDINLEVAIASEQGVLDYYVFNETALNSLSRKLAESQLEKRDPYRIERVVELQTEKLSEVLNAHLPAGQRIDFLSVDAEGFDFDVLRSNDWTRYRPEVVLVEILDSSLADLLRHEITQFMRQQGYTLYAKCVNTVFFRLDV